MARAAFVLGLIPGVAARWFGLYSVCATDATCNLSKCENSTLYLNRCEYVGGPGMMSTMNICNQTSREFVTLEYADSPNCAGEEHPNAVSLASCLTGPFGGHTEFNCGTVPYVPAPPPGGIYGQIVLADSSDVSCNDTDTVEWEWFTPGACTSPGPFEAQIIDCDLKHSTWSRVVYDSVDCSGPVVSNTTGMLNACTIETSGYAMVQCDTKPIPPP